MSTSAQMIGRYGAEVTRSWKQERLLTHLPHIKCIAQQLSARLPANVEVGDLVSEGVLGLMDALEKFDRSRGVRFKTYAESRVRGAMLDSLRDLDWVPRSVRRKSKNLAQVEKILEQRLCHPASETEVADELGISLEEFRALAEKLRGVHMTSLDEDVDTPSKHGEKRPEFLPEWRQVGPFSHVRHHELQAILSAGIQRLPKRERLVISLYYYDGLTMKEIGAVLGFNESRASQYHSRAKAKLLAYFQRLQLRRDCL